jgi:hypothetical protein
MTISVRSTSGGTGAFSAGTFSNVTLPAGWQPGDLCTVTSVLTTTGTVDTSSPGWNSLVQLQQSATPWFMTRTWWKVLETGDTRPVLTSSGTPGNTWQARCITSSVGPVAMDAVANSAVSAAISATPTPAPVTPQGGGRAALAIFGGCSQRVASDTTNPSFSAPAGWTMGPNHTQALGVTSQAAQIVASGFHPGPLGPGAITPGAFTLNIPEPGPVFFWCRWSMALAEAAGVGQMQLKTWDGANWAEPAVSAGLHGWSGADWLEL